MGMADMGLATPKPRAVRLDCPWPRAATLGHRPPDLASHGPEAAGLGYPESALVVD